MFFVKICVINREFIKNNYFTLKLTLYSNFYYN